MSPRFLEACLAGQTQLAEAELGASLPEGWPDEHLSPRSADVLPSPGSMAMRLTQMREDPDSAPWLLRAMLRKSDLTVLGYINFHGPPDGAGRAELGYTVLEPHRRQGYASEAALTMMRWAHEQRGVSTFVVSVSPNNVPSLAMAASLGFVRTGTQIDEIDGEEYVFELQWPVARG